MNAWVHAFKSSWVRNQIYYKAKLDLKNVHNYVQQFVISSCLWVEAAFTRSATFHIIDLSFGSFNSFCKSSAYPAYIFNIV